MKLSELAPEARKHIEDALEIEAFIISVAIKNAKHNRECECGSKAPVGEILAQRSPVFEAVQDIAKIL